MTLSALPISNYKTSTYTVHVFTNYKRQLEIPVNIIITYINTTKFSCTITFIMKIQKATIINQRSIELEYK